MVSLTCYRCHITGAAMAITLRDVAARAGVSAITVSRALNNTGYVSLETRERINAAVAELNYVPNAVASSLRSNKTQLLALLLTDITNPFWTTVARAVEDGAMEARSEEHTSELQSRR